MVERIEKNVVKQGLVNRKDKGYRKIEVKRWTPYKVVGVTV
jgi:hypothetical protein